MKPIYLRMMTSIILSIVSMFFLCSCAKEYDMSEDNFDSNITFGGEAFSLPIGSTTQITLSTLIDTTGASSLKRDADGNYYFEIDNEISEEISFSEFVQQITIPGETKSFTLTQYIPSGMPSPISQSAATVDVPFNFNQTFIFKYSLEDAVEQGLLAIDSLILQQADIVLKASIRLNNAIPPNPTNLSVTASVDIPKSYVMKSDARIDANNHFSAVNSLTGNGTVSFNDISIRKVKYNSPRAYVYQDTIVIKSIVLTIPQSDLPNYLGKNVSVTLSTGMGNLTPDSFYGKVNKAIDPIKYNLPLSGIPSFLKQPGTSLDFYNPRLLADVSSNLGLQVNADMLLSSVYTSGVAPKTLKFSLFAPPSSDPTVFETNHYWISNSDVNKPSDYNYIKADLPAFISQIPDSLSITMSPRSDTTNSHFIKCSALYKLSALSKFVIPFSFGSEMSISMADTINNISDNVAKLFANEVTVGGKIESTFPVKFELQLVFLDEQLRPIVSSNKQVIDAVSGVNASAVTPINIVINDSKAQKTKSIALNFTMLSGPTSGIPIKSSSYIKATLNASLPGGINIDLEPSNKQ